MGKASEQSISMCILTCGCIWLILGITFSVLWGNTTPPESPLWLNVGLCRNSSKAKAYGSSLWMGPTDLYTQGNSEGCKSPVPDVGKASISKIATKHLVKDFPYFPRVFATDLMDIISLNVTVSYDGELLKTWTLSTTSGENGEKLVKGRRLSTSGRKLLKGGSSSSGSNGPSRRDSRSHSSRYYRTGGTGVYVYSSTRYGGRKRRAVEGTAEGFVHAVYSPVAMFGERQRVPNPPKAPAGQKYAPLNGYKNSYNNINSCTDYQKGCEVTMYSSLSLYEMNGEGKFITPTREAETERKNPDFYQVSSTVHARFDAETAAMSDATRYTTEFPKIFVTFATDRADPNNAVYGTLCVLSWIMLFCSLPCGAACANCLCGKKTGGYSNEMVSTGGSVYTNKLNDNQTHDIPLEYTANIDQFAVVQPMQGDYYINKYNDDYTNTDIAGNFSGRVTRINLHTNDVAVIRGLNRMPLLSQLDLCNNNLKNLNGLNQSRSLRKLVVDDNNLINLLGLASQSIVYFRARNNDLRNVSGVQAPMLQLLDCANNDIADISGISSSSAPSLKVLNLSNNNITSLTSLCNMAYLEAVCVSSNDIKNVNQVIPMINSCPSLKYLDLRNNDLPESNINQLKEVCQYHKPVPIKLVTE